MSVSQETTAGRRTRDTTINFGKANPQPRASNDWYVDQPEAAEALLRVERFSGLSWGPACGLGTIPNAFKAAGLDCSASDIVDRGYESGWTLDFLGQHDGNEGAPSFIWTSDNIICNPPFNLAREFIECALVIASHKVAMLLPLTFLEGQARAAWLQTTPLARVHVFSWRISMPPGELLVAGKVKPTGGKKCFAWFVWEHGWKGPAQINLLMKAVAGKTLA